MAKRKTVKTKQGTRAKGTRKPAGKPSSEVAALLGATGFKTLQRRIVGGSELAELSPETCRGRRTIVHKAKNQGLGVSSELKLHDHPVVGTDPDSDQAMILLGRLTRDLRGYNMTVDFMVNKQGVAGLLLKKHLCCCEPDAKQAEQIEQTVDEIDRVATCIEADLKHPVEGLELAAFPSLMAQVAEFTPSKERSEPFIVPTFDNVQLANIRARSEQIKG